jgi:hypothetical protein
MGGILVKVDATVGKLSEGSLLLDLSGLNGVLNFRKMLACIRLAATQVPRKAPLDSAELNRWELASGTHIFVSHDCGGLTLVRFSMIVDRRMWS